MDLKNVENVIIIPNDEEAQSLMSNSSQVPDKCKYALTISGYTYYPAPNYRTYASAAEGQSKKSRVLQSSIKQVIEGLRNELKDQISGRSRAEAELEKLKLEMEQNKREVDAEKSCRREIHSKMLDADSDIRLLRNENDIEKLPNISALEEDADKANEDIVDLNSQLDKNSKRFEEAESDREVAKTHHDNYLEKRSNIREKGQHLNDSYKERQDIIEQFKQELDHYMCKKDQYKKELTQSQTQEAKEVGEIENLRQKAEKILTIPPSADQLRKPERIFREIEGLEKSLQTQQVNLEPVATVIDKLRRSKTIFNTKNIKVNRLARNVKKLKKMLRSREEGFSLIQASVGRRVQHSFNVRMDARHYRCVTSYVLIILVQLYSMQPPFRVLDEFDVFMDMVNKLAPQSCMGQV